MNFFEQELRKIVGGICPSATYAGRTCYVRLTDSNRAKIEFTNRGLVGCYSALQVTILNENKGVIDSLYLNFADILCRRQDFHSNTQASGTYISSHNNQYDWYGYQPTSADYSKLQKSLLNYLMVFDYLKDRKQSLET